MDSSRLFRSYGTLAATAALLITTAVPGTAQADGLPARPLRVAEAGAPELAPLPTGVPRALRPYYRQRLSWHACPGKRSGFECATLRAPLDYASPGAGDVRLAVSRKKAAGDAKRLGSLMLNPGGPGGSAIDFLQAYAAAAYPAPVRARYDLVAMDPRGVAGSQPVTCLSDPEMDDFAQVDATPDDEGEVRELVAAYKKFSKACAAHSGKLLRHVSTVEAARDMDVFRAALGDDKLHYVGASYGTFLGATYAGLFPSRVGRLVLDGALDPSLSARQVNRDQTAGFQTALSSFAEDCARHDDCPLDSGRADVASARLRGFFKHLDQHPLATGRSRPLTESLATTGVISAMYDEASWPLLRRALNDAESGDGALLLRLSDAYYERNEQGHYTNLMPANAAVNCLDLPSAFSGPADVRRALPAFEKASPVLGESFAWSALSCAYWPVRPTGGPHRIPARGAAPILVVGTTRDPATPYPWARSLARQLSSGRLLTYEGDGHTAYTRGSSCVDGAINDYLLGTTPPPASRRCS
ncbi:MULTISPECIES: alpha/beta hydrolase [Streptomyces]|uniref:Alpha/beta hydrolase n=1 Tax=Streptomyces luteosporeus TaxID=173856 RepID=A0ABN3TLA8_9ACTN